MEDSKILQMVRIITHDIMSPILKINGILQQKNQGCLDAEEEHELLEKAERCSMELAFLIKDVSSWTFWIDAPMEKQKCNLLTIVKSIFDFLSLSSKLKNVHLISKNLDIDIVGDPIATKIILRNIIANAIKFTGENGRVEISCKQNENGPIIAISDNGVGMSEEKILAIKNGTAKSTVDTDGQKSSGLGWKFCLDLIEKMGWKFDIESQPEKGTCVSIFIPKEE